MDIQQYSQSNFQRCYLQKKHGQAWVVYNKDQPIDIVWFSSKANKYQVRNALVYNDGYPVSIEVRKPV